MELRDDRANYPVASRADITLHRIIDCEFKKRARNRRLPCTVEYFENLLRTKSQLNFLRDYFSIGKRLQEPAKSAKYARLSMQLVI